MIQLIDGYVGELLGKLKELGLDQNTLVLLTSDNGPHQEGGHVMEFFDSNGRLRGYKRDLYEGGIRVPLIARWPGKIEAGTVSKLISGFQDMMPTFVDVAGVSCPSTSPLPCPPSDGISMLPTMLGQPEKQREHEYLYWEFPRQRRVRGQTMNFTRQAVRKGKWKAFRETIGRQVKPIELYDLDRDMGEQHNLAEQHPDVVAEMAQIMAGQ
jgi:arylsulfatase A-like enzyme